MKNKRIFWMLALGIIMCCSAFVLATITVTLNTPATSTVEDLATGAVTKNFTCKAVVAGGNDTIINMSLWHTLNASSWDIYVVNKSRVTNDTFYNFTQGITSDTNGVWNCQACDNSSMGGGTNNSCAFASSNYTYTEDSTSPTVSLNSPNGTQFSSSLTFSYTPSDRNFGNCSLHLTKHDSSLYTTDQIDTSISNGTANTFSKTLSEAGTYKWIVGCSDKVARHTNSSSGTFVYDAGGVPSGGGGGPISPPVQDIKEGAEKAVSSKTFWIVIGIIVVIIIIVWFAFFKGK